jgi:hypothetical protein
MRCAPATPSWRGVAAMRLARVSLAINSATLRTPSPVTRG